MNPNGELPIAVGATVVIRDEEWLVRSVSQTSRDGMRVDVRGRSELVRDQPATFFTALDDIAVLDPRHTILKLDESPHYIESRLWLDALLRESPVPMADTRIVTGHRALLDQMPFQLRPAELALTNPHPRILIADAVGLGKTLEIGITLSDLIRRGRGERILVVTPRAVLEQFQHEMWTKFSIPLVRLDSDGIQKVRQTLPASRNPFSYYRRVIVSIDTLKNPVRYRHFLQEQRWDVVVIDECHNLINPKAQNHQLAQVLARNTDALILSSATPHNGKPESFAELIGLLDPTAIKDKSTYTADDIASLYVRRHRNSDEVGNEVGDRWAPRLPPQVIAVDATPAEEAVLEELQDRWLKPRSPDTAVVDRRRRLFPWTLLKSFLSSPSALSQSIENRQKTIAGRPDLQDESDALEELALLNEQAAIEGPAKLAALLGHLHEIGVGSGKPTRVVIFSERIRTLEWLERTLTSELKLRKGAIAILHAQLSDNEIQDVVEQFGLGSSKLRILLASDMASEGLNLHLECHQLVHYDLPWSFIRIQQRNGRIDRYLQTQSPRIAALALTSADTATYSDLRVVTRLLQKEYAANQALGDAGVLLNLRDDVAEEEAVMEALHNQEDLDAAVPDVEDLDPFSFDVLFATAGEHEKLAAAATAQPTTLFHDDDNFLYEALTHLFNANRDLDIHRDPATDLIAFDTPDDLGMMLRDLPADYLKQMKVTERIRLTGNKDLALKRLALARESGDTLWPDVQYVAPVHPVLSWAAGRLLARYGRNEAPVIAGKVDEPIFLMQALWSNNRGQAALARWVAISGVDSGNPQVSDLIALVPAAVDAATRDLTTHREDMERPLRDLVEREEARVREWTAFSLDAADQAAASQQRRRRTRAQTDSERAVDYLQSLLPAGDPYVRVVGVIAPEGGR